MYDDILGKDNDDMELNPIEVETPKQPDMPKKIGVSQSMGGSSGPSISKKKRKSPKKIGSSAVKPPSTPVDDNEKTPDENDPWKDEDENESSSVCEDDDLDDLDDFDCDEDDCDDEDDCGKCDGALKNELWKAPHGLIRPNYYVKVITLMEHLNQLSKE